MATSLDIWSLKQRLEIVFKQSIPANVLTIIIAFVFADGIDHEFASNLNWQWAILTTVFCLLRAAVAVAYQLDPDRLSPSNWLRSYFAATLLLGTCVASSAVFYSMMEDETARTTLMMLLIGIIAGAMVILNAMPRVFMAYVAPIFIAMFIAVALDDHHWSPYLLIGFVVYMIFIMMAVSNSYRHSNNLLELQYKNKALVADLSTEIQHREDVQQKLIKHQHELEELVDHRTIELRRKNDALSREIQRRKEVEENLKHLAHHDSLTKLPNRLLLNDRLDHLLFQSSRHGRKGAVLFIDLNGFKKINDEYGHDNGDLLLRLAARRLTENLRQEDTIARYGGDEFVVLTEFEDDQSASTLAEKIISLFERDFELEDKTVKLGCSIGVSLFPQHATDAEELLKNADEAMYEAKNLGYNAYRIYSA